MLLQYFCLYYRQILPLAINFHTNFFLLFIRQLLANS